MTPEEWWEAEIARLERYRASSEQLGDARMVAWFDAKLADAREILASLLSRRVD